MASLKGLVGWLVVASVAVATLSGVALAETAIPPEPIAIVPTVTASPPTAQPGDTIEIAGSGFDPCATTGSAGHAAMGRGVSARKCAGRRVRAVPRGRHRARRHCDREYTVAAECAHYLGPDAPSWQVVSASTRVQVVCVSGCPASLLLSSRQASTGDRVAVTGDGYLQCSRSSSVVQLLWDGTALTDLAHPDTSGHIAIAVTVPDRARTGRHAVAAQCYDPETGYVTSGVLADSELVVVAIGTSGTGSSQPTTGSSPPTTGPRLESTTPRAAR